MAEMNIEDRPPAAVADVWMMLFSLGPNFPPRMGKFSAKVTEKNLMTAKPRMAPNKLAEKVQPVLRPIDQSLAKLCQKKIGL